MKLYVVRWDAEALDIKMAFPLIAKGTWKKKSSLTSMKI